MKRWIWVVTLLLSTSSIALAKNDQYVVASSLNVREQPSFDSKVIAVLPITTKVQIISRGESKIVVIGNEWHSIEWMEARAAEGPHEGKRGWLNGRMLWSARPTLPLVLKQFDEAGEYSIKKKRIWLERADALAPGNPDVKKRRLEFELWSDFPAIQKGPYPLVDLNSVKYGGIVSQGEKIVFHTKAGKKTYDVKVQKWSYMVPVGSSFYIDKHFRPGWSDSNIGIYKPPSWYPQPAYHVFIAVDDESNPSWLLSLSGNEDASMGSQWLVDLKTKIIYQFPPEGFVSFNVVGRTAWLGSGFGITSVNLDTLERTDYLTLPPSRGIVNVAKHRDHIYFAIRNSGVIAVNESTGVTKLVFPPVLFAPGRHSIEDLAIVNNKLIVLVSATTKDSRYAGHTSTLFVYDLETRALTSINTGVEFADRLVIIDGVIFGYGDMAEGGEGGRLSGWRGGLFSYNLREGKVTTMLKRPLRYFNPDRMEGITFTQPEYDGNPPLVIAYQWSRIDGSLINEKDLTKDGAAGRRVRENDARIAKYKRERIQAQLSNLKVRFDTIAIPAGRIVSRKID